MAPLFKSKNDVYSIATDQTLQYLKRGIIPWLNCWTPAGIPQNLITHEEFRGINILLLASLGYFKNFFLTPKQLDNLGGKLMEGEKGHPVFYWKCADKSNRPSARLEKPVLRYFYVYNIAQCSSIKCKVPKIRRPRFPLEMCASIAANMPSGPTISHGDLPASYMSTLDCIDIPRRDQYGNDEMYFATLFRCMIHSTGHENRLNRKEVMAATVTDHWYHATESLIGDIGASHLASLAGIRYAIRKDAANYCRDWVMRLKQDPRLIIYASTQAQCAVDYILRRTPEPNPL